MVDIYASRLLNKRSSLTYDEEMKESERVYLAAGKRRLLTESMDSWTAPSGLSSIKKFYQQAVSYL